MTYKPNFEGEKLTVLLGVAVVDGLLALLAVGLALGGLVGDHGLHEVAEGGDPVVLAVAVGVVGGGGRGDLEDDVRLLGDGGAVGGVRDGVLIVDVVGLDLEVHALLGVDGVVAGDLELLVAAVLELTGGGLAVLGDEILVLHGLGHELGGDCWRIGDTRGEDGVEESVRFTQSVRLAMNWVMLNLSK